jgi:hypothetical protein
VCRADQRCSWTASQLNSCITGLTTIRRQIAASPGSLKRRDWRIIAHIPTLGFEISALWPVLGLGATYTLKGVLDAHENLLPFYGSMVAFLM